MNYNYSSAICHKNECRCMENWMTTNDQNISQGISDLENCIKATSWQDYYQKKSWFEKYNALLQQFQNRNNVIDYLIFADSVLASSFYGYFGISGAIFNIKDYESITLEMLNNFQCSPKI